MTVRAGGEGRALSALLDEMVKRFIGFIVDKRLKNVCKGRSAGVAPVPLIVPGRGPWQLLRYPHVIHLRDLKSNPVEIHLIVDRRGK